MIVAKQGHGDSLCGIYSLVNAFAHFEGLAGQSDDRQREIFRQLVLAADRLDMLNFHHLTVGFEAFELISLLDFVAEKFGYPVSSQLLESLTLGGLNHAKVITNALKDGDVAVVYDRAKDHWVALVGDDDPLDSWPHGPLTTAKAAKRSSYGLIIKQIHRD